MTEDKEEIQKQNSQRSHSIIGLVSLKRPNQIDHVGVNCRILKLFVLSLQYDAENVTVELQAIFPQ